MGCSEAPRNAHAVGDNGDVEDACLALNSRRFAWIENDFESSEQALGFARALIHESCAMHGEPPPSVIGDFVIPPSDGERSRDFQTLHFDFGLPLDPKVVKDVAGYTALHIPEVAHVSAVTRLVPLQELLGQRAWPTRPMLVDHIVSYGKTHGAWNDAWGYAEGSLARLIEAAAGASPLLPSVKTEPNFLCGLEFDSMPEELGFFAQHGLAVDKVETEVPLRPGELLVFDNLALAHGRRGARQPGELHQRVFGLRGLTPAAQLEVRDRILDTFYVHAVG